MTEEVKTLILRYTNGAKSRVESGNDLGKRIVEIFQLVDKTYEPFTNEELVGAFLGLNMAITIVQATKTNLPEDGGVVFNTREANFASGETLDMVNRSLSIDIFVVCLIIEKRGFIK